jgi:hypothetical protein
MVHRSCPFPDLILAFASVPCGGMATRQGARVIENIDHFGFVLPNAEFFLLTIVLSISYNHPVHCEVESTNRKFTS